MSDDTGNGDNAPPYTVGYRKPPVHRQFKPGQSGNPRGRPKKPNSIEALLGQALDSKIDIKEGGKRSRMSMRSALVKRLLTSAVNGDHKAIEAVIRIERSGSRPDPIVFLDEDDVIAERYLQRLQAAREQDENDEQDQENDEARLSDDDVSS